MSSYDKDDIGVLSSLKRAGFSDFQMHFEGDSAEDALRRSEHEIFRLQAEYEEIEIRFWVAVLAAVIFAAAAVSSWILWFIR